MSKIFIRKQEHIQAFELSFLIPELFLVIIFLGTASFITFYPLIAYLILLGIWILVSYLLYKKHPEGTLYSNNNTLYYYHLYKLNKIKFEDIISIDLVENKENKFIIKFKNNEKENKFIIKNHEAHMLVIELNKTIHKGLKKQK